MKKLILSMFVIASFGFYAILQNAGNSPSSFTEITPVVATSGTKKGKSATITSVPNNPSPAPMMKGAGMAGGGGMMKTGIYKNGEYIGNSVDAYYGYIQVKAVVAGGRLSDVIFLDHPQDRRTSVQINNYAMPILKSEAIRAQNSNVNTVSGATDSSGAFRESLADALAQAKI